MNCVAGKLTEGGLEVESERLPSALIGADKNRLDKLQKDMSKLNKRYSLLDGDQTYSLKSRISGYWERVLSAAMEVCDHIFNTPVNEHPLILSDQQNIGKTRWKLEEPELSILNILLQYLITNFIDSNMMSKYDVNKLI